MAWHRRNLAASSGGVRRAARQENCELLTMHLKIAVFQSIQPALIFQSEMVNSMPYTY